MSEGTQVRDGLERRMVNGKPTGDLVAIIYQGQRYPITGMGKADFEEVEKFLLSKRQSPLLAIKGELESVKDMPWLQQKLIDKAYDDMRKHKTVDLISRDEVIAYLDTREGGIRSLWLALRKQIPGLTLEKTDQIMESVGDAEMLKARDDAIELPEVAASTEV